LARSWGEEENPIAVQKNARSEVATVLCVCASSSPSSNIPDSIPEDVEVTRHSQAASFLDEDCAPQTRASSPAELFCGAADRTSQAAASPTAEAAEPRTVAATTTAPETAAPAYSAEPAAASTSSAAAEGAVRKADLRNIRV